MHFSLHANPAGHPDPATFFRVHTGEWTAHSPWYADRKAAVKAMEDLILHLRKTTAQKLYRGTGPQLLELTFFGRSAGVAPSPATMGELDVADDLLTRVKAAAAGNTYRIIAYERVIPTGKEPVAIREMTPRQLADDANWREAGSSLLHITKKTGITGVRPAIGVQLSPNTGPCSQIFNALQPFASTDISLFRGRKRETEEIYTLLQGHPVLLLYGPKRVGKTSLVQCGLANRIKKDRADVLMVSCSEGAVFDSLDTTLQVQLTKIGQKQVPHEAGPLALARQLAVATDRRQYLVFDQIEDILTADVFDADRAALLGFIRDLSEAEPERFRIILCLREEYLAPLAEQEMHLPGLLTHRFRLLPLRESSMANASVNFLDFLKGSGKIAVDDTRAIADRICRDLADENGNVPAHCLQIYLHQVHQKSCRETTSGPVPINEELLDRFGPPQTVINEFYAEQLSELEAQQDTTGGAPDILVQHRIQEMQGGRRDCGCSEEKQTETVVAGGAAAGAGVGWMAGLMLLPLGALLMYMFYPWGNGNEAPLSACDLLEQAPGDCTAYVNYLCSTAGDTTCQPAWLATTDLEDCEVWRDYKTLTRRESCVSYQAFYQKYKDQGVCMDFVQPRLLSWECPLVVDTLQLTVRDTIIQRVPGPPAGPTNYGRLPNTSPTPAASPDCQTVGSVTLKSVGPLLIATTPVPGGPFRWEDALDACAAQNLRLPCVGEIDFLIERIYRDDPERAYQMLSGTGPCNLFNPSAAPEGRIEFWTATEATDGTAWSYFFDTGLKTIGRQSGSPKSARLPCLCVKKDPNSAGSSLPACYGKEIKRGE